MEVPKRKTFSDFQHRDDGGNVVSFQFSNGLSITPVATGDYINEKGFYVYVGVTGDVAMRLVNHDDTESVIFTNVPAGTFIPARARAILQTGTDATDLIAGW